MLERGHGYEQQESIIRAVKELVNTKIDEFRLEFEVGGSLQGVANAHQATKLDKIRDYLHLLYDAHKVEHKVDKEIEEALKMYRAEAGI